MTQGNSLDSRVLTFDQPGLSEASHRSSNGPLLAVIHKGDNCVLGCSFCAFILNISRWRVLFCFTACATPFSGCSVGRCYSIKRTFYLKPGMTSHVLTPSFFLFFFLNLSTCLQTRHFYSPSCWIDSFTNQLVNTDGKLMGNYFENQWIEVEKTDIWWIQTQYSQY